ncbi:antibiotic biosynthesis monooxygenase [Planktotalea sp.]|uniref:antibiotic biosynthesis monooxygenase family protein n=1 Tax=Planktotalea sp. TaxID=2029877 RepID=UPI00329954ED
MYIAMNRFSVALENAADFEVLWLNRESHLDQMKGFVSFDMLKGPETDGVILYASHTVWENEQTFRDWTRSAQFRDAHKNAGQTGKLHMGHPSFEGFNAIQSFKAEARP